MAEKPKKPQKLRARLPRGLADRGPAEIAATRAMVDKIREVYERYGFEPVETPAMEYTDALGKFLPDQDRPNEGVFSFQDDDEQWISLRYDLTAPLARYVAENFDALPKPYRSYREGYVYRNEKPGPGRFRQFMQFDADTVGSGSPAADAEMCMMAADTMEALGIPRGSYVVKVNNRKVLDGVMESIGLGGDEHVATRLTVLRADRQAGSSFAIDGVEKLLGAGRWDGGEEGKGDFTKGAGLSSRADRVSRLRPVTSAIPEGAKMLRFASHVRLPTRFRRRAPRRLRLSKSLFCGFRLRSGSDPYRSLRRARPRILHRPGLRSRTHARNQRRKRPPGAFRLGRRRRTL